MWAGTAVALSGSKGAPITMKHHLLLAAALAASAGATAQAQTCRGACVTASLVGQLRFTASESSDATSAAPVVELRRLRPTLRLAALDGRLLAQVGLNTTPAALEVMDAWAEYALTPALRLRGGQAKVSFTSYRMRPFTELAFVDWALVTRYFGGERQLGFELHDRSAGGPLEFAVGVWNGTTMRAAHGQGVAPVYAEAVENLSDLRAIHTPDSPHPELVGRLLWRGAPGARVRVEAGLNALVDLRPVAAHDLRAAFAPELSVAVGRWRAELTGYLGLSDLVDRPGLGALGGLLAEVQLRAHERVSLAVRYARVDRSDALLGDARDRAARLIGAAPDAQRAAAQRQYADAGAIVREHELTAGVVVRLVGTTVVWQSDVGWLRADRARGARDELRVRTQLQLTF
jgi:hypothetical protein